MNIALSFVVFALFLATVYSSRWSLQGKRIVVTGGSKGIGRACVEELCEMGATVLTCARNQTEIDACLSEWKQRGYDVHVCLADVSSETGRDMLVNQINAKFGGSVDSLVNNVGFNIRKRAIEYSESEYERIMDTNLKSAFSLTLRMHPLLKRAKSGASVVNIGSVAGKRSRVLLA